MSRAAILSFSERGAATAERVAAALTDYEVERCAPRGTLRETTARLFPTVEALVWVTSAP